VLKQVLRFADNELTFLGIDAFHAYQALQQIYLARNRIQTVAPDAFRALRNIQILDLAANRLRTVPTPAFRHISSVRMLSLKSNPITYIAAEAFRPLVNLEELNLENCWLNRVQPGAFAGLSLLGELNLVNNELTGLPAETQADLTASLTVLRLHRNPWTCDCRLRWLRRFVDAQDAGSSSSINWDFAAHNTPVCAGPDLLRGVSWRHLVADQFACPPVQVVGNGTTSVELQVGTNASISCVVGGDPPPVVTWMKGSSHVPSGRVVQRTKSPPANDHDESARLHSILRFTVVSQTDAGDYKCVAVNPAGRSEVTYKVWVVDGRRRDDKPRDGRGTDVVEDGDKQVQGAEVVFGAVVGVVVLIATFCVCATCVVVRKRRRALQNVRKPPTSAGNSYVLAVGTPVLRQSEDDVFVGYETASAATETWNGPPPNHSDARRIGLLAHDDDAFRNVETVHVAPFQLAASPTADEDVDNSPSEFAMKIFAANTPPVDDASPTADATPCPPPPDSVVEFPPTRIEPSPDVRPQRSAEPRTSSPHHADNPDDCSYSPVNVEDLHSTSIADAVAVERRLGDRSRENLTATCLAVSPHRRLSTPQHGSHCVNPICLRERLDRSSTSLSPGDMCSHRLALSGHTSSSDHARPRVAVVHRPRGHSSHGSDYYDTQDATSSLSCRPAAGTSSVRRNSSSSPRMMSDVGYYSTLSACRVIDGQAYSPRPRVRHTQFAAQPFYHVSTLPRRQRLSSVSDRRRQRQSTSPTLFTRKLSGSSSALDIRDLEIATTSAYGTTLRGGPQSTSVACTSLHDILCPPFIPPTANGPKPTTGKALRLRPGDQDEFGTAV